MAQEYQFDGKVVEQLWESMSGDYWVITENFDDSPHFFGYARLAAMPQFAEWGTINGNIIKDTLVWQVERENWTISGPKDINIEQV
jgi:hypothetical protein